ncbi:MAG: bifunctional heptose 7-phosphate kinase/heptose 1-phosphate adenyltransferase [Patescibacteria group bacterium]
MEVGLFEALARIRGRRVLVLGDVIADVYLEGRITRISREAPVPILEYTGETLVLGGAGNAAANVQSLGGRAVLAGIAGDDAPGTAARALARRRGIDVSGFLLEQGLWSCTKTRILAGSEHTVRQQMLRVDRLPDRAPGRGILARLENFLAAAVADAEALVLSDYGLGILPVPLYRAAMRDAAGAGRAVIVDSRHRMLELPGATLYTPNTAEAEEALGRRFRDEEDLIRAGAELLERLEARGLLITRGPDGMTLFVQGGGVTHIPAANRLEVFDVCGAGDTVVAGMALGLAAGLGLLDAAFLANCAAGAAVRRMGTAAVGAEELISAIGLELVETEEAPERRALAEERRLV